VVLRIVGDLDPRKALDQVGIGNGFAHCASTVKGEECLMDRTFCSGRRRHREIGCEDLERFFLFIDHVVLAFAAEQARLIVCESECLDRGFTAK
jgi:hypothetical protein